MHNERSTSHQYKLEKKDQAPIVSSQKKYNTLGNLVNSKYFYLIYLIFYFVPWFFRIPTLWDIAIACIAVTIFLPIYFGSIKDYSSRSIVRIAAMETIGMVTTPFHGMSATYHIYACCQSAFLNNRQHAVFLITGLNIIWLLFSLLMKTNMIELMFGIFIAFISSIGCLASAEQIKIGANLIRSRTLDKQLAAIAERERIARDLHDVLGQTLTMVSLKSEIAEKLIHKDPARAEQEIIEIRNASRDALKDIRTSIAGMITTDLKTEINHGKIALKAANISHEIIGTYPTLSSKADIAIGLVLREVITNIIRHSDAKTMTLEFSDNPSDIQISIHDDGKGIRDSNFQGEAGLAGVRHRIQSLQGQLEISNSHGTRLTITVPQHHTPKPAEEI